MAITTISLTSGPDLWTPATPTTPLTDGVLLTALQGNDTITGTDFADEIYGGQGDDIITGGAGDDILLGNQGNDTIRASSGDNEIYGGQGDDYIIGGTGNDILLGNQGNDTIEVISNNNEVFGGQGNDVIISRFSNNTIYGNKENDTITIQGTNSYAHGGDGTDKIILEVASATTLIGGAGDDVFEIGGGLATPGLIIRGGSGADGLTPSGINTLLVTGSNDFSGATIFDIAEVGVASGANAIFNATTFFGEDVSRTIVSGAGTVQLKGTSAEITAALANVTVAAGTVVQTEDGTTIVPTTIGLSRDRFDLPTGLTEFFVIDGSQFSTVGTLPTPDTTNPTEILKLSIGALSLQFGEITTSEFGAIVANPAADIPAATQAKIVAFGQELNNASYIPQVTMEQSDTLLPGFYTLISGNGITPVNNRFFSVIDTKGTAATTDDVTELYYSSNGQFDLSTSEVVFTSAVGFSGFTPSNPPLTSVTLDTIAASTQLVPIA